VSTGTYGTTHSASGGAQHSPAQAGSGRWLLGRREHGGLAEACGGDIWQGDGAVSGGTLVGGEHMHVEEHQEAFAEW
jgi:hypothetical protein